MEIIDSAMMIVFWLAIITLGLLRITKGVSLAGGGGPEIGDDLRSFKRVLADNFAEYDVATVPKSTGGHVWHEITLSKYGQVQAVIFWTGRNGHKNPVWWESRRVVEASGVKFVNFYSHMPNQLEYILDRLAAKGVTSASNASATPPVVQ